MNSKRIGRRTVALQTPPSVLSFANIGGRMEGQGPLAKYFDELCDDSFFGEKTWEKAEATMQRRVLRRALEQAGLKPGDVDYVLAGDLLNQCIGSSFGLRELGIPFFGLYGACSTMGEALALASLLIDGGFAETVAAQASSHFCTAERQYRMPVPYGSQRSVDRHRRRLHPSLRPRAGALYHSRHLRENCGSGYHRSQQHGGCHGPRRL